MTDFLPAIVVVAFDRPDSLGRLLNYLKVANYDRSDIPLVISVDYANTKSGQATRDLASNFNWHHGTSEVILHDENLGLRKHILGCGDLTTKYGSIIMLEDDLTVSREFYRYSESALKFSNGIDSIGGVSLYNHCKNFICQLPFHPVYDGFDNYYLQIASSWGQAWTEGQWSQFRNWYQTLKDDNQVVSPVDVIPSSAPIHPRIANWPNSSWLKYFIWFLAETNRYFLYPRQSLTTNHADPGTHVKQKNPIWQVPVSMQINEFRFSTLENSLAIYDAFFEILPEKLKLISPPLSRFDFDVDLFASKSDPNFEASLVLSSAECSSSVELGFDLTRKPFEANFEFASESPDDAQFRLMNRKSRIESSSRLNFSSLANLKYFFGDLPIKTIFKNAFNYWRQRFG